MHPKGTPPSNIRALTTQRGDAHPHLDGLSQTRPAPHPATGRPRQADHHALLPNKSALTTTSGGPAHSSDPLGRSDPAVPAQPRRRPSGSKRLNTSEPRAPPTPSPSPPTRTPALAPTSSPNIFALTTQHPRPPREASPYDGPVAAPQRSPRRRETSQTLPRSSTTPDARCPHSAARWVVVVTARTFAAVARSGARLGLALRPNVRPNVRSTCGPAREPEASPLRARRTRSPEDTRGAGFSFSSASALRRLCLSPASTQPQRRLPQTTPSVCALRRKRALVCLRPSLTSAAQR